MYAISQIQTDDPAINQRLKQIDGVPDELLRRELLRKEELEGKLWIDLGTGKGEGAYQLSRYGASVIGVDISEYRLETAIKYGLLTQETAIRQNAIDYLKSLKDESVDGISLFKCNFSIFAAIYPSLYGSTIYNVVLHAIRVLRKGGLIIFTSSGDAFVELENLGKDSNNPHSELGSMGLRGQYINDLTIFERYAFVGRKI